MDSPVAALSPLPEADPQTLQPLRKARALAIKAINEAEDLEVALRQARKNAKNHTRVYEDLVALHDGQMTLPGL